MSTLTERLKIVMEAMGWEHADVVRVSGMSSSVVSQWLGKGSKIIKTIGKLEAAEALAMESGFSALWIAKGIGPELAAVSGASTLRTIKQLQQSIARMGASRRKTVGGLLARLAEEPANDELAADIALLIDQPAQQTLAA